MPSRYWFSISTVARIGGQTSARKTIDHVDVCVENLDNLQSSSGLNDTLLIYADEGVGVTDVGVNISLPFYHDDIVRPNLELPRRFSASSETGGEQKHEYRAIHVVPLFLLRRGCVSIKKTSLHYNKLHIKVKHHQKLYYMLYSFILLCAPC